MLKALNPTEGPENDHNHCGFANFECDGPKTSRREIPSSKVLKVKNL